MYLAPLGLVAWIVVLSVPVLSGWLWSKGSVAHVLLVQLPGRHDARLAAAELKPYAKARPQDLVIVEPAAGRWPCRSADTVPAQSDPLIPGVNQYLPDVSHPARVTRRADPAYCDALPGLSARAGRAIVLDPAAALVQAGTAGAGQRPVTRARLLLRAMYGAGAQVTGGPFVFSGLVTAPAGFGAGRAGAAVLLLSIAGSAVCVPLLYRRGRGSQVVPLVPELFFEDEITEWPTDRAFLRIRTEKLPSRPTPAPVPLRPLVAVPAYVSTGAQDRSAGAAAESMEFPLITEKESPAARMPWRLPASPSSSAIAADTVQIGDLDIRAASLVGPSHRCEEPATPRQDAYRLGRDAEGRYLLVAVADGMSDSEHSDLGANVAVQTIIDQLRSALANGVRPARLDARVLFQEAALKMAGIAQQRGIGPQAVRAAAMAAVIPVAPDPTGGREAWFGTLADVSAWRRQPGGWQHLAGQRKSGMDGNRLSVYLPFHADQARSTTARLGPADVIALTTDGVADVFTSSAGAAAWFADRWQAPPAIASFMLDVGYEARTQLDDRTAVVVWCGATGPGQ